MMTYDKFLKFVVIPWVFKLGGKAIGPVTTNRLAEVLLKLFSLKGRPVGLVASAPEGVTAQLKGLCDQLGQGVPRNIVLAEAEALLSDFALGWQRTRNDVLRLFDGEGLRDQFRTLTASFSPLMQDPNKRVQALGDELQRALVGYADGVSRGAEPSELSPYRACVLSMGERLLAEAILRRLFLAFEEMFKVEFICLEPKDFLVAASSEDGYTDVEVDEALSTNNIRAFAGSWVTGVLEAQGVWHKPVIKAAPTFFMPGFYVGAEEGMRVACMPFNASDYSGLMLQQGLHTANYPIGLGFVKHVNLPFTATCVSEVLDAQNAGPAGRELVMSKVLYRSLDLRQGFEIFDPTTGKTYPIPP